MSDNRIRPDVVEYFVGQIFRKCSLEERKMIKKAIVLRKEVKNLGR